MDVLYARCAGLDVHKKMIIVCLLTPGPHGQSTKPARAFSTMTADLLILRAWLSAAGCTHVAMESTEVYWKPIWRGKMCKKRPELEQALLGHFGPHQRFLVAQQWAHIDSLDATIRQVSAEIAKRLLPYEADLRRLETIPGVGRRIAEIIIAELGGEPGAFSHRQAPGVVGWLVPWQSGERRQALHRGDPQGRPLAA